LPPQKVRTSLGKVDICLVKKTAQETMQQTTSMMFVKSFQDKVYKMRKKWFIQILTSSIAVFVFCSKLGGLMLLLQYFCQGVG